MLFIRTDLIKFKCFYFILDSFDIKLYKPGQKKTKTKEKIPAYTCRVKFDNKALELILLSRSFNLLLPITGKIKKHDNNCTVT